MFEKEAEEYANKNATRGGSSSFGDITNYHDLRKGFKDGAELGYNKAKEEMIQNGLALQSDMDKTIEQNIALKKELNKANEWHYVKDGDLPKEEGDYLFYLYDKETKFTFYEVLGIARTYADRDDLYIESMIWTLEDVIAWKEIVLPKESEVEK